MPSSGRPALPALTAHEISTLRPAKNLHAAPLAMIYHRRPLRLFPSKHLRQISPRKRVLHGIGVAMYIVGQERRLVDPPSQVVAGVRTVTTNMDGRDALPRMSRPFAFIREALNAPPGNLTQTRRAQK